MSSPIQGLFNSQLGNAATVLYTSPSGIWTQISKLTVVNTDTASRVVTFYLVPSGGSAATANITTNAQAVFVGQTWNSPNEYGLVLNPGDFIEGFADSTSVVNCFIAGILTSS